MNTCAWCNRSVADDKTIWVRKNLVIGYPFCSNKCSTQWKSSKEDDKAVSSNNSRNTNESNSKSIDELLYEREQKKLLQEKNEQEDIEKARKTMIVVRKILPHWKIIIPSVTVIIGALYFINSMLCMILLYIIAILIAGAFWAYFNEPKN